MNPIVLHTGISNMVVLFNAVLGGWGLLKYFRNQGVDSSYWGGLSLSPILGLVQLAIGIWMLTLGLGSNVRFVHYLYGALVVISVPATFAFTNGRDDRPMALIYGAMCLIIAGFGLRGITTAPLH